GARLVTISEDHTIRIWDVATGECTAVLRGHTQPVAHLALSRDGDRLVSGAHGMTARLWSMELAGHNGVLRGSAGRALDVAFSRGGRAVVSIADDRIVRFCDATTGRPTRELRHEDSSLDSPANPGERFLNSLALSPDGRQLVSVVHRGSTVRLWDVAT